MTQTHHIPGTAHPVGVLVEGVDEFLPMHTPHFHRLVVWSSNQPLTIGGEAHTAYGCRVRFKPHRLSFAEIWHRSCLRRAWISDGAQIKIWCVSYILGVHNLTVLSLDPEATSSPDGEKCTAVTTSWCPTNLNALDLGLRFHIIRVLSQDPVAGGKNDHMIRYSNWFQQQSEAEFHIHTQLLVVGTEICTRDSIFVAFKMSRKCRVLLNQEIFVSWNQICTKKNPI